MVRWCFPFQLVWISLYLSLTLHLVLSSPPFLSLSRYTHLYLPLYSLQTLIYTQVTEKFFFIFIGHNFVIKWIMILKVTWGYNYVVWFLKNFRSFDQITTLTYVLMDKFCPCFILGITLTILEKWIHCILYIYQAIYLIISILLFLYKYIYLSLYLIIYLIGH